MSSRLWALTRKIYSYRGTHQTRGVSNRIAWLVLSLSLCAGNWLLQGIFYTDRTEKMFRILVDILLTAVLFAVLAIVIAFPFDLIFAFLIAHTINWLFNGHFWALVIGLGLKKGSGAIEGFSTYAKQMRGRIGARKCIEAAALYGSLSRGQVRSASDLDTRVLRKPGLINGIKACLFVMGENSRALVRRFPLDLHVADSTSHFSGKIRKDEPPVILYDPEGVLRRLGEGKGADLSDIAQLNTGRTETEQ